MNLQSIKKKRHIKAKINRFDKDNHLEVDLILEETIQDSMVIATPFEKKKTLLLQSKKSIYLKQMGLSK